MTSAVRPTKAVLVVLMLLLIGAQTVATVALGVTAGLILAGAISAAALCLIVHIYWSLSATLRRQVDALTTEHLHDTRQTQSLFYLFSMVQPRRPLPPMRDMAISPDFAATLVSLVAELRPQTIVEFGSGTSTLLCGYSLEKLGAGRIISIDHDEKYAQETRQQLREHGVENYARVIYAPLESVSVAGSDWRWYSTSFVAELPAIDLLIVDGPPGWLQPLARYPALPLLLKRLSPTATVLIDDAARPDERLIVDRWMKEIPGFTRTDLRHEKGTVILRRVSGT